MIEHQLLRIRAGSQRRRSAISELSFTYTRLHGLIPGLMRRVEAPMSALLERHRQDDRAIHDALVQVAMEHGQPPVPSACTEASALIEGVYHAGRGLRRAVPRPDTLDAVLVPLKDLRLFLIQSWGRLIQDLHEEDMPSFRMAAIRLQGREAEKHRELVQLLPRMGGADGTGARMAG